MSQRKTSAGLEAKRGVGNPAAGSSQMAGELGELKRRFNSAPSKLDTPTELASGMTRVAELNLRLRT